MMPVFLINTGKDKRIFINTEANVTAIFLILALISHGAQNQILF
jgi:hypothetical protein